ncbi:MAG: Na/Pi cotransporter family protein [Planctomycetaceae bacterium]|nr:Na/Pi cotransporter family protein [Planctomycetaceae bacterium]
MTEILFRFVGGIGVFLLGMSLLTDGLKDFAGPWLRIQLLRFTGTPFKAFVSGLLSTLIVQSSSATTVAVIGFVSAGLLTFPQSLGVVFGASLGTTGTGWIVAIVGLKFQLGLYVLPLLAIGVFLRLLGKGRKVHLGNALVGFALIFVGLEFMQMAMQNLTTLIDFAVFARAGIWANVLAVIVGFVLTLLMQSSSATVATTLTAVHSGAISFDHAAGIIIGAAIGTTITGVLAALRANVSARRTALAHVTFNACTGFLALLLLPLLLGLVRAFQGWTDWEEPAIGLAAFHTLFIAMGVMIFLPNINRFASWIERVAPDHGPVWTRHLDEAVRRVPSVALVATERALRETARRVCENLERGLEIQQWESDTSGFESTIREIQEYLEHLPVAADDAAMIRERQEQLHALDHLLRLNSRLNPPFTLQQVFQDPLLLGAVAQCRRVLSLCRQGLSEPLSSDLTEELDRGAETLRRFREQRRLESINESAMGHRSPSSTLQLLDALRWLDRAAAHAAKISTYLK